MSLAKKIFYDTYVFRCVYLFYMIGEVSHILDIDGHDFIELLPINFLFLWGCILLVRDLTGRRMVLEMKNVRLLIAFIGLAGITSAIYYRYTEDNYITYLHQVIFFFVFCVPDVSVSREKLYKGIFAFFAVFAVFTTFMAAVALFSFVTERTIIINTTAAVKYEGSGDWGRLKMFMLGPNPTGLVTFVSIASLLICAAVIRRVCDNLFVVIACRVICAVLIVPNIVMLIHTDTRGAVFALMVFLFLFSFLAVFSLAQHLAKRDSVNGSIFLNCFAAFLVAALVAVVVYRLDSPVRTGFAVVRAAAAQAIAEQHVIQEDAEEPPVGQSPAEQEMAMQGADNTGAASGISDYYLEGRNDVGYTDDFFSGREGLTDSSNERLDVWMLGLRMIRKYPLFGVSQGGYWDAVRDMYDSIPRSVYKWPGAPTHMHNAYIHLAVTNGLPAFMLLMLFFVLYIKRNITALIKASKDDAFLPAGALLALCAAIAFYCLYQSVLFPIHNGDVSAVFWVSLGFAATLLQYHSLAAAEI